MQRLTNNLLSMVGLERESLFGKFGKDILWNIASYGVMALAGIGMNILIIRWYDHAALGVFNQVYAVYMILSQFGIAGVHLSVVKYVAQYSTQPEIYRPANTAALILSIIFASISTWGLWLLRGQIGVWLGSPAITVGLAYAAPGIFFFSINKLFLGVLNGLSHMRSFGFYQAERAILIITTLLGMAFLKSPAERLPFAFTLAEGLLFVTILPAIFLEFAIPTFGMFRRWIGLHFSFGLKSLLSNVLLQMNTRVDVLVLGVFWSDTVVGVYSFASTLADGIYQLLVVLRSNYNPLLVRLISQGRLEELKTTVIKGRRLTYILTALVCLAVLALYPLGSLITRNDFVYLESWPALAILLTGVLLSSGYIPFGALLLQAGRPELHTLMTLIWVIANVIFNLLLASSFGAWGAALATALTYLLFVFLLKGFTRAFVKVKI